LAAKPARKDSGQAGMTEGDPTVSARLQDSRDGFLDDLFTCVCYSDIDTVVFSGLTSDAFSGRNKYAVGILEKYRPELFTISGQLGL
jgi:hypothetical protein